MKDSLEPIVLPYVARTPRIYDWVITMVAVLVYSFFLYHYTELITMFKQGSWFLRANFLIAFVVLPLGLLGEFFSYKVFGDSHIERISLWRGRKRWSYDEVHKVEDSSDGGHIRITFLDGRSIKIWKSEANLQAVRAILTEKCG